MKREKGLGTICFAKMLASSSFRWGTSCSLLSLDVFFCEKKNKRIHSYLLILAQDHIYIRYVHTHTRRKKYHVIITRSNSIVMIPPACLLRITRCRANVPIVIRWTALEERRRHRSSSPLTISTLSLQLESIDRILRQTELILSAGDQSSVRIDRQICPLE